MRKRRNFKQLKAFLPAGRAAMPSLFAGIFALS